MSIQEISTIAEFKKLVTENDKVMVKCFAKWCGPCKALGPRFQAIAAQNASSGVTFAAIDVDASGKLPSLLRVVGLPTVISIRKGKEKSRVQGVNFPKINSMLTALKE
ncbi:Thioredoxin like protein [Aduncisulcus paluster]|uniref:Thioredoxin n=1 Tax=Aduncisulcus paluster TaxID=2918883 RepID=A0ABQ5KES6_9EUKA|nr:Thioredoxin like protein [Aduncisulcus paluster]|eukprot:gnl/Carplike_NY0171/408_a563_3872.p1 GENE.gnl/Carplike_NY0171/408_a563_3872~~gnl/Carplike_NY0171/408_a563_3872.p1  ORF type:complete len:108 (+),score=26.38 gnl/Carplike_NY0171/408_a563_3872:48-371(+)